MHQVPEQIPLQAVEKTMVKQAVPLKPMETHGDEDTHTVVHGGSMLQLAPVAGPVAPQWDPRWSSPFLKDCVLWKGSRLKQS